MDSTRFIRNGRHIQLGERRYKVIDLLGSGGSGQIYKVELGDRTFALKLFFPFHQLEFFSTADKASSLQEVLELQKREYRYLSKIDHPNIVKVYDTGEVELQVMERRRVAIVGVESLPAIVTEYVEGEQLKPAIASYSLDAEKIAAILLGVARALGHLHRDKKYMHMDIKSANVMVRKVDQQPVLIDFALCKNLDFAEVERGEHTQLLGDWDLFPKDLPTDHGLKRIKEKGGTREEIYRNGFPHLDLFQFGKMLQSCSASWEHVFEARQLDYLRELGLQLTDWGVARRWSADDLEPRIARLAEGGYSVFGVPELTPPHGTERSIIVPPETSVPITNLVRGVIETRSFRRLASMNQLNLLSNVYWGADYKRRVHALHAYEMARQLVMQLYSSSLFRVLFDSRATQQLLVCALLHDINHFPLLHVFQESRIPGLDRLEVLDLFCSGDATGERANGASSLYELLGSVGLAPERFKRLLFSKHHEHSSEVDQAISSVLNSGVDIDKLSYLFLDAYFTGVGYGRGIDFPCILKAATVQRVGGDDRIHLAFADRAIQALEHVVMTRFWSFRSMYWHHTNRAIMAMLLHVIRRLYAEGRRDVRGYLVDTMWMTDGEVVRYLDKQYKKEYGAKSIIHELMEDRTCLYKRLYTVRAGMGEGPDDALHEFMRDLDYADELSYRGHVAEELASLLKDEVRLDDVLLDIPRRPMDSGGDVYVLSGGGDPVRLENISEPVRAISANYARLTQRIRVFVSPRVARLLGPAGRVRRRKELLSLLQSAIQALRGGKASGEVK